MKNSRYIRDYLLCVGYVFRDLLTEQIGDPSLTALPKAIGVSGDPGVAGRPGRHEKFFI